MIDRLRDILKAELGTAFDSFKEATKDWDLDSFKNLDFLKKDDRRPGESQEEAYHRQVEEEYRRYQEEKKQQNQQKQQQAHASVNKEAEYYATLELQPGAGFDQIKAAYRSLMKKYHPDRFQHDQQKHDIALEVSRKTNEAYAYFRKKYNK